MAKSHIRGKTKGDFCATAVSGGKCTHKSGSGNSYQDNGKPKWTGVPRKPSQAHHLLPVTCVTSTIMSQKEIQGVIRGTTWCINDSDNMLGMPTWGGTVKHYCNISILGVGKASKLPPGFQDYPQHLADHDLYNQEVSDYLSGSLATWASQDHDVKPEDIRSELLTWSSVMESELLAFRGIRGGGTHICWEMAVKTVGMHPGWYEPFSMASVPRPQSFPLRVQNAVNSWAKWFKRIKG